MLSVTTGVGFVVNFCQRPSSGWGLYQYSFLRKGLLPITRPHDLSSIRSLPLAVIDARGQVSRIQTRRSSQT